MKSLSNIILLFLLINEFPCDDIEQAVEFDQNIIQSDLAKFSFKANNISFIVIITENTNLIEDTDDQKKLTVVSSYMNQAQEYNLLRYNYFMIEDAPKNQSVEFLLKFKNYKNGSFIIFNSANPFQIKIFEKVFSLDYNLQKESKIKLDFVSDILINNIHLEFNRILNGNKIYVKNLSNDSSSYVQINNSQIDLKKGSRYAIQFIGNEKHINFVIQKSEYIYYNINDELKLTLFWKIPVYILFKVSDFMNTKSEIYLHLHEKKVQKYYLATAYLNSTYIQSLQDLDLVNQSSIYPYNVYKLNLENSNQFILSKIYLDNFENPSYTHPIFKIFHNFETLVMSDKEILNHKEYDFNCDAFVFSNITNLRTFEDYEPKSIIYSKDLRSFSFIILPPEKKHQLNYLEIDNNILSGINNKIYKKEFSFNYLSNMLINNEKNNLFYFDVNKKSLL